MDSGNLKIQVVAADGAILVQNATVTLTDEEGNFLYELTTDNTGHIPELVLPAPPAALVDDPFTTERRYSIYDAVVQAEGYQTAIYRGIMVFGQATSILVIDLHPLIEGEDYGEEIIDIEGHALDDPQPEQQIQPELDEPPISPFILPEVIIPNTITVHLGRPNVSAPNVRVPFIDYIKNVASHEIFDNWPEEAIIANVWAIVSLTLNRVFTNSHRMGGYKKTPNYHENSHAPANPHMISVG